MEIRELGRVEIRELGTEETCLAYETMVELRPHVGTEADFVARVNDVQRPAGYRLVGAFDHRDPVAVAVVGFHIGDTLAWGHYLYVEDLVTRESERGAGRATALLDWIRVEADRNRCDCIHLDSAVHRHDAHRFYLGWGFVITSHHFGRVLGDSAGR